MIQNIPSHASRRIEGLMHDAIVARSTPVHATKLLYPSLGKARHLDSRNSKGPTHDTRTRHDQSTQSVINDEVNSFLEPDV